MDKPWQHQRDDHSKIDLARKLRRVWGAVFGLIASCLMLRSHYQHRVPGIAEVSTYVACFIGFISAIIVVLWAGYYFNRGLLQRELADLWEGLQLARNQPPDKEGR